MEQFTERKRLPAGAVNTRAAEFAGALRALSDAELVRLKALARLWSRGLPGGLGWADVLNEAVVRTLDGSRHWPAEVPLLAFLSGVMRSICDDHWRRLRHESGWRADAGAAADESEAAPDPERVVAAAQALAAINQLFAADAPALKIIAGLAEGLGVREICRLYDMSEQAYDAARKRMRRALLRHGLVRGSR